MKLILREDVPNLGKSGEIVDVSDGYGRNYLLPRKVAVQASTKNMRLLEHQKKLIQASQDKKKQESRDLAGRLESVSCTIARKAGEEDKLFGSVSSRDIAEALREEGIELDRKKILLDEPIRQLGLFAVTVHLHPEVKGTIKVWVVKE